MSQVRRQLLLILALALLGTELRLHSIWLDAPDALYHLRRARFALAEFPRTIIFDPLINFPDGAICIWPPLFDVSLALPARLLKGPNASIDFFKRCALAVPLLYAFGAIAGAGLCGMALRKKWGGWVALFVAISPGHLQYSQYGHADQHVAESCWGFLALAFFLWSARRKRAVYELLAGVCLLLALLTWQGSIFWAAIFSAALVLEILSTATAMPLRKPLLILGVPAILLAAATCYWLNGLNVPFTYVSFGWFQPVFVCASLFAVLFVYAAKQFREKTLRFAPLGWMILAAIPVLLFFSDFLSMVKAGLMHMASHSTGSEVAGGGFLSYSQAWLSQIVEYRPLFTDGVVWPIQYLSFSLLLVPLALFLWGRNALRKIRFNQYTTLFIWGSFTLLFTLTQRRNVYYAALLTALVAVEFAARCSIAAQHRLHHVRGKGTLWFVAVFCVLIAPMVVSLPGKLGPQYSADPDLLLTLNRLRSISPEEVRPYDLRFLDPGSSVPELKGASSVMAFWSQGHLVSYFAERPVVADNFGYGYLESLHFFFATTEEEALRIANAHRVRYVLLMDLLPVMNRYGAVLGRNEMIHWNGTKWTPSSEYFETMQSRLYDFDGRGASMEQVNISPLVHFKLVYSSPSSTERFGHKISRWKVFEIVR